MDIGTWLGQLGLERYEKAFIEGDVDASILPDLTDSDLKELGIPLGSRKKLLRAIAKLAAELETPSADQSMQHEAERRQLTVLFCDLVGSTELSVRLDPEDMSAVIRTYQECCEKVIGRWNGHIARFLGDGILVYFGYPHAYEDDAERGVRTGLDLASTVSQLSASDGTPLAARIGIATGVVLVGELIGQGAAQEETVVGDTPNLAARLQSLASPNDVVIADGTRRLLGNLFEFADLGQPNLKGFGTSVRAWRVVDEGHTQSRFEALRGTLPTGLVGRQAELNLLLTHWERASTGKGQVVLLAGEPGIGKSRLVQAIREQTEKKSTLTITYYCSPHHTNSALYPVVCSLESVAGFNHEDGADTRLEKLEAFLKRSTQAWRDMVPHFADLLGVNLGSNYNAPELAPQIQKQRTLGSLVNLLADIADRQTIFVFVEDVHWADPTTLELLGMMIQRVEHLPVLMMVTYRPSFNPTWPDHEYMQCLSLPRLTQRDGETLVDQIVGSKALPVEVLDEIVAKTDGVPLFVEELTKTILESGMLTDAGDHYRLAGPLVSPAIPSTLQDSLMARLDRLSPVKEIAQLGAVIGRQFSEDLIIAASHLPKEQLSRALDQLVDAELLSLHGSSSAVMYSFKHALVRDVAYESLLKSKRPLFHRQIADAMADLSPQYPGELAYHWERAGVLDKALDCRLQAAGQAVGRFALWEAINEYWHVLTLLEQLPPNPDRQRQLIATMISMNSLNLAFWRNADEQIKAIEHIDRALEAADQLNDLGSAVRLNAFRGSIGSDEDRLTKAINDANKLRNPDLTTEATLYLAAYLGRLGRLEDANRRIKQAVNSYGEDEVSAPLAILLATIGRCCLARAGEIDEALAYAQRGQNIAEATENFNIKAWRAMAAEPYLYKGHWKRAAELATQGLLIAKEYGEWFIVLWLSAFAAKSKIKLDCLAEAKNIIDDGWRTAGAHVADDWPRTYLLTAHAELYFVTSDYEAALATAQKACSLADQQAMLLEKGTSYRILGQVYAALGRRDDAVSAFQQSIDILGEIHSRPELGQSMLAYGQFLMPDEEKQAKQLLMDALKIFEDIKASGWIDATLAVLRC